MAVVIFTLSCEEKDVKLYPVFEESAIITIDESDFEEHAIITASTIDNAIADVADLDKIEDIMLEAIWLEVRPKAGNTATSMTVDLKIKSWNSDLYLYVVDDYVIPVEAKKITLLQGLVPAGVNELKDQLDAFSKGSALGNIDFETEGTVSPKDEVVDVEIEIYVRGTVVYKETIGL